MKRVLFAATTIAFLVMPAALMADDALRTQIRADLANDPRAAAMNSGEFNALVEALAVQAQGDGTADNFLESRNTFDYAPLFTPPHRTSVSLAPILIAILALFSILTSVVIYGMRNRGRHPEELSDAAT